MSPPVPKPRTRYQRDGLSSALGGDSTVSEDVHPRTDDDAPPPSPGPHHGLPLPTLAGVTDFISASIPSLAGVSASIRGSSAPPASIPALSDPASAVAPTVAPPAASNQGDFGLHSIMSSLANIPSFSGIFSGAANPAVNQAPSPGESLPTTGAAAAAAAGDHTDVGALSQLVMSALDQASGVTLPPAGPAEPTDEVPAMPILDVKRGNSYVTVLACWDGEEAESESSNEDEDPGAEGPMAGDPASCTPETHSTPISPPGVFVPTRLAPPPPRPPGQLQKPGKRVKQKIPRAATIRVSRKKGGSVSPAPQGAVFRSSWLDVWKGRRHNVLWATMDGQQMSLWKKRTDQFSELLFHVSSITNVKKQDKGRFSVYFRKKHYDFMAHSDEVQDGWVTSLLASRGQPSPVPAELHGPITIKDTRSRVYAAVWSHALWVYPNKEGYQLGVASFSVPLNVATVKPTGKHSLALITPYKSFKYSPIRLPVCLAPPVCQSYSFVSRSLFPPPHSLSVDSKELSVWLDSLSSSIRNALSCGQVTLRLSENPANKVCGDCGSANPEWASVNLLLVVCQACAGQHRALGSNLSKVRSVMMDNKVWTEPLIQLFVTYGNWLANQVWAAAVPAAEQLLPDASDEQRSKFIRDKYSRARYRRVHPLSFSLSRMDTRLREVVCGRDVEETMSLICSGAKVRQTDPQSPAPLLLAERAGQALQSELLRLNEYTEVTPHQSLSANRSTDSAPSSEEGEELHGKLEEDRFLFSLENDSAACDVLDLREVLSVFVSNGAPQFEMVTLSDQLICAADDDEALQSHLVHILKVILPMGVSYAEVGGASAVSKVCVVDMGGASGQAGAWLLLWDDGISIHPVSKDSQQTVRMELSALSHHVMDPAENIITMETSDRSVSLRFEEQFSCSSWYQNLQRVLTKHSSETHTLPPANHSPARQSLYPDVGSRGLVPPGIERCISHITAHGLKVQGIYRRCGLAAKVNRLVEVLKTSPSSAPLESDEQGVLDACSALKQYVRQQEGLIRDVQPWMQAAVISDEHSRFKAYQRLLWELPDNNRATLSALFAHFYMVQVFSQVNKMSAQNLALVLVPSLFQSLNQDLLRLTREFIIHHTLLFLTPQDGRRHRDQDDDEQVTVF